MKLLPKIARKLFYVYEHWRPDVDLPFYVGKGKGKRAWESERNYLHSRVVTELAECGLCLEVRLVAGELTEQEAYAFEEERIAFWRSSGVLLTNLTDGGEGFSDPTGEIAAKISKTLTGKKRGPHTPEHCANIGKALTGRIIHPNTIAAVKLGNKKPRGPAYAALRRKIMLRMTAEGQNPGCNPKPSTKAKIGNANRNPPKSTRALMRAAKLGRIKITNGVETRLIQSTQDIPVGWSRGQTFRSNTQKRWITNGIDSKKIALDQEIPVGWHLGLTMKKRSSAKPKLEAFA